MRSHLLRWNGNRAQISICCRILKSGRALLTLQQKLHATEAALDLSDARNDPHRVQYVRRRLFGVVALRDSEDEAVALQGRLDRT